MWVDYWGGGGGEGAKGYVGPGPSQIIVMGGLAPPLAPYSYAYEPQATELPV